MDAKTGGDVSSLLPAFHDSVIGKRNTRRAIKKGPLCPCNKIGSGGAFYKLRSLSLFFLVDSPRGF